MSVLYEPIDLDFLIEHANSLEPLPSSATRLSEILSMEDWELEDVVDVVSLDQGLTGKLLAVANSASNAAQDRVSTVDQAVVRLGGGTVLAVAIGAGVKKQVDVAIPAYGMAEGQLWSRSVAASLFAGGIRHYTKKKIPIEASTAALLHDVGKLVLARFLDEGALHYLAAARECVGLSEERAEIEVLGVNHAELGGLVAQHWNLPPVIVEGICYHHAPMDAYDAQGESMIAYAVSLSSEVADFIVSGSDELPENTPLLAASKIRLGISMADFKTMCFDIQERFQEVEAMFG